jgi:hypothetical protein
VSQLLEALQQQQQHNAQIHTQRQQQGERQTPHKQQQQSQHMLPEQDEHQQQQLLLLGDGTAPSHKRYASQAVLLQPPKLVRVRRPCSFEQGTAGHSSHAEQQDQQLVAPQMAASVEQPQPLPQQQHNGQVVAVLHLQRQQQQRYELMQVSIHSLGADMLMHEVRRAFPDSPRLAPLTAVVTFQFCGSAKQLMLQQQQQQQQLTAPQGLCWTDPSSSSSVRRAATPADVRQQQQQQQRSMQGSCQRAASAPLPSAPSFVRTSGAAAHSSSSKASTPEQSPAAVASGAAGDSSGCPCRGDSGADGSSSDAGCSCLCSGDEMQAMLTVFMTWQQQVCSFITAR